MPEYPLPLANLRELFGDQYHVRASAEYEGTRKTPDDPFHQMIPCRNGVSIWPYGAELLGVSVKGKMIDQLLDTGVIIREKSAICRDDPDWYRSDDVYLRMPSLFMRCGGPDLLKKPMKDDLESNLIFHVKDIKVVADLVGARKRRKRSPEERQRYAEYLKRWQEHRGAPQETV